MYGRPNISMMRSFRQDPSVTHQKLKPGTVRRILTYAKPYRLWLTLFLIVTILDALITVVNPLLLRAIIDKGILGPRSGHRDRRRRGRRGGRDI